MKILQLLILLICLSITLSTSSFRFIDEISPKEKVCKKAPNNYKSKTKYILLSSYVKTLGETNKNKQKFIRKLLLENSLSELGNCLKQMASYLVMIGFGIAFLLSKYTTYQIVCYVFVAQCLPMLQSIQLYVQSIDTLLKLEERNKT